MFFLALVGHALLLSSQVVTPRGDSVLRGILVALFSPIQRGAEATAGGVRSFWFDYVDLRGVKEENRLLQEKLARLEQALWVERDALSNYRRLSGVMELAETLPYSKVIVAEVVGFDASAWFRTITVNRGSGQGVALNAPVISSKGLVGRVISVGSDVAQIQLISDRDCAVGALLGRTRIRGVVAGKEEDGSPYPLELKYVSNLEDVSPGDRIITSGMDGIYHKGIAIGRVAAVRNGPRLFKLIDVEPTSRFERLEEVLILSPLEPPELTKTVE